MFSDLSVNSIVIPPASTGTTAISRAAVQYYGCVWIMGVWLLSYGLRLMGYEASYEVVASGRAMMCLVLGLVDRLVDGLVEEQQGRHIRGANINC